jgi:hypothetical protein
MEETKFHENYICLGGIATNLKCFISKCYSSIMSLPVYVSFFSSYEFPLSEILKITSFYNHAKIRLSYRYQTK